MKKLKTLLTMAIVALMSLSFTSCDEDADIGYTFYMVLGKAIWMLD